jgi:exodeoxyribonuclease VII large subunit
VGDLRRRVEALGPEATLARGYAIVQSKGRILRDVAETTSGDHLLIRLQHGRLNTTVESVEPEP